MRTPPFLSRVAMLVLAGSLVACGSIPRADYSRHELAASPGSRALDVFRVTSSDDTRFLRWMDVWTDQRRSQGLEGGIKALGLSGGGANGAYGAGVLVGWTRSGARPEFDFVSGVSTGALIAPLAFVGPAWDERLSAAYHDPSVRGIISNRLSALRHPSLYSGASLRDLVERYVDAGLVEAVAARHEAGARLMIATTNLDTQETLLWDMGSIALDGRRPERRDQAVKLFQDILVASASIPGVFPPVMIPLDRDRRLTEMHVDGGVTTPFFLIPETMAFWRPETTMRPTQLYVIINGQIGSSFAVTQGRAAPIMARAFDTLGRADARAQLIVIDNFASRNGATLGYAAIPDALRADPLRFEPGYMAEMFDLGAARAEAGEAFTYPAAARTAAEAR